MLKKNKLIKYVINKPKIQQNTEKQLYSLHKYSSLFKNHQNFIKLTLKASNEVLNYISKITPNMEVSLPGYLWEIPFYSVHFDLLHRRFPAVLSQILRR